MAAPIMDESMNFIEIALADFSFVLVQEVAKEKSPNENFVISPISVIADLTLVQAGARGRTAQQIKDALNLSGIPDEQVNLALASLIRRISYDRNEVVFACGSEVFVSDDYQLDVGYVNFLKTFEGTSPLSVNFKIDLTRLGINRFVEENTAYHIREVFPAGSLDPGTRILLLNAVYFRGVWLQSFSPFEMATEPFYLGYGNVSVNCQMMYKKGNFRSGFLPNYDARVLEIQFQADALSMYIVLPNQADGLPRFETRNFAGLSQEVESSLTEVANLRIAIPKFTMASDVDVKEILLRLGMIDLFHEQTADLSGMCQMRGLFVSNTVHRCIIEVNEEGTVESNLGIGFPQEYAVPSPPPFVANHPFYYYVRSRENNAVILAGRLINPQGV